MLKRICFLCIAIVALLATLSCGRGRLALLVTRAAEHEPNTPADVIGSASGYALVEIEDFLDNAARLDWSPQGDWIAYDKREADGYSDMYRIRPDGTDNECLTCDHPDLPNKNTGNPTFHPDGRWLLFQAEKQDHEWAPSTSPGRGPYNDLYVMDLESDSPYDVYQLTDVRSGYPVGGSLHPHFSRDGTKLLWGDLEGSGSCFGDWRIAIADFDDQGPELTNVTYYEPGDNTEWYEAQDWSLDDGSRYGIYFSCAPLSGQDDRTMEFCYIDLATGQLTRLTETSGMGGESDEWDEHGKITPAGDAITWMTSTGYEIDHSSCDYLAWLETDLWIMNTDGSGKTKLTHYNEPGYPEYDPDGVCVSDHSWSPEGTKLAVEVYFRGIQTPKMKIFHFSRCGDGVCDGPETAESCPQDCGKDYEVVSITTLTTDGGRLDWSHDGQWIYYDHLEPDGLWDVYRIHPDGTGNECITCDRPELPNNNQGQPQMHPNGRYLVFQAEKAEHEGTVGELATGPGRGYYNDLWVLDLETGSFRQLTDVRSGLPAGGSLHSHFSNDGTRLLWSDLERYDGRFGDWQLAVADFVTSPSPHLENYQYYNPGPQPIWLESHGWGPDDSWIYFTCTPVAGMDDNDQDICCLDLETEELTRLTFTSGLSGEAGEWDEHAHLSPLHDAFSWMSSTPYGTESIGDHGEWLRTELWLMSLDGSNQRRITFFNETEQVIVADNDWNPSPTGNQQLAVTMFMRDRGENHIKIVEFSTEGDASAATIVVDAADVTGTIRSLQGINAGPRGDDSQSHMFRQYEDIGVDYVRTHDYYGPSDMHVLFPDLQADPNDESSYNFVSTDRELEAIKRVGAEVLFRLGESCGFPVTYVAPEDHDTWAQAAVHVAKHYNDGWADGFQWGIEYWEVWNEPDITQFWTGTREEYFHLYETVARALKTYDPTLKVGGPSWCCDQTFFRDFLAYCRDHQVPLDFVSWHYYGGPVALLERAVGVQQALDTYGFTDTENLLTEWNLSVEGGYEHLRDATSAAYTALVLSHLQDTSVTIANRYRGDGELGMFGSEGFYTKPAYSFLAFQRLLETPQRLAVEAPLTHNWSTLAGRNEDGEMVQILISNYASNHTSFDLTVTNLPWDTGQPYRYERYLLDETHDLALVESADVSAGSDSFTTSEEIIAPAVQLIRLFVPAGETMPQISIRADQTLDPISPLLYGLNHRYLNSGYGVWDADAEQVYPEVISRSLEIGFPVTRFPGGTVGSTYHWTDGIGPPDERPTGISGFDGAPATNEYGFDEQMLFMEQVGATTNVVVNFGTGTAQEAAAFVAYANGDPSDTTPIGVDELRVDWGTVGEWAAQREANQIRLGMTPHSYEIEYWEVGNELYGDWEYSWTHGPVKYAAGGTAWQYDQPVVKEDDWRDSVSCSNGQPSQVFYVRYPPVVTGTQTITVSGVAWTEVPDLSAAGPDDAVYQCDLQSGEIRFGDGVHGRIPPLAAAIRASYESGPHDGFVDYYAAMKAVDPDIKVGSCFHTDTFLQVMGEEYPYDFLAVHPYYSSGDYGGNGLAEAHLRTMAGPLIRQMDWEDLRAAVRLYAGERADQVEIAITEYNLYVSERHSPTPHYGMSLDQGLFVADMVRTMIELGVPLGDLHCLIGNYEGEGWGNTPVLSPYPQLIPRPAAYILQLFNQHFAPVRVESEVEGALLLTGSVPALEVVASTDEAGERLTLLAINKETTAPFTAAIAVSGFTPAATASVWTLNGEDISSFNDTGHPTDVVTTESAITDAGEHFVYSFPAHSVTLIELVAASSHPTPTPTATPTSTPTSTPTASPGFRLYLPLILRDYTPTTPTPTPTPTSSPTPSAGSIVLADSPDGLELVSVPVTIPLTVGHVAYLPVEVQDYHRPISVTVQTLIHTFVNDVTPPQPGESHPFTAGTLEASQNELKLQTLRMRSHPLTLTFTAGKDVVSTAVTLETAVQPHTPLFGVHSSPYYDGLPAPFVPVWGPDCGSCPTTPGDPPGSTRDIACAKQQDSCHCHHLQFILDPRSDEATRRQAPEMQRYASQLLRSLGGWGSIQIEPGEYLWTGLDWVFNDLLPLERDYFPLFSGIMDGNFGWMTCPEYTNPDGSVGFFDPNNTCLLEQYGLYVQELTSRYAPELRFIEMSNEPAAEFYLCPCGAPGGSPCDAISGPNQPACLTGPDSSEFVATYGDLLFTATDVAAEELAAASPGALLITGALEMVGTRDTDLTETTEYMISQGLLDHDNVAVGIHQYPYLYPPNWISPTLNCAYYQVPDDPFWLPAGCETAPPFDDYTTPAGRPVQARQAWQDFDQRVDSSGLLHEAEALGVLDRFYLFDTELHAGFHDCFGGEPNPSTTPAREALAGLRIGSINAHQRVLGSEFVFAPSDPAAYNLMVKHLAGATPVYGWDAPLMDASYDGLVYKLFTRGDEDIIALWSNAEMPLELVLTPLPDATKFKQVTLTSFADAHGPLAITTANLDAPPATIQVEPLKEFHFLSVISDRSGFGWLAGLGSEAGLSGGSVG